MKRGGGLVILMHGLSRTSRSFLGLELDLRVLGYATHAIDYASTRYPVGALASQIAAELRRDQTWEQGADVHFVTHSMGGIVLRRLISGHLGTNEQAQIGRVVMLAPPNHGSEVADLTSRWPLARRLMGPALDDLTSAAARTLPDWDSRIALGVIAGTGGWAYPLGQACLPRPHDGRVSVASTRLMGMRDHLVLPASHTLTMRRPDVRAQVAHFLQTGWFAR